jgi:hypothetical protein
MLSGGMATAQLTQLNECNSVLFRNGARTLLVGSSGAGKTHFVSQLLTQSYDQGIFQSPPSKFIVCSHAKSQFLELPGVDIEYISEIPVDDQVFEPHTVILFDDLLSGADVDSNAEKLLSFFCRRCHHENLYCFVTAQNLFSHSKHFRTLSLNANYLILFKTHRSVQQVRFLAQQIFSGGGCGKILAKMYNDATRSKPFSYLFIDFHPLTDEELRFKTNVLEESDKPCTVYRLPDAYL